MKPVAPVTKYAMTNPPCVTMRVAVAGRCSALLSRAPRRGSAARRVPEPYGPEHCFVDYTGASATRFRAPPRSWGASSGLV